MRKSVKTRMIKIGNMRGVRIPKALLDRSGLPDEVELVAQQDQIVIRSTRHPRAGWEEQFRAMAVAGADALLDAAVVNLTMWDVDEWEW